MRASSDIVRQARRAVAVGAPLAAPAPPNRKSKARQSPMALAVVLLVLLLLLLAPVFLVPPSHAARVAAVSPLQPGDRGLLGGAHPDGEISGAGGRVATARRAAAPCHLPPLSPHRS